jgi:polysaccharide pyruvyl transferase WcaK-like protein
MRSSCPHLCYMSVNLIFLFLIILNIVTITKLLITQFSQFSRHLIPLRPNILLSTLFSNILSLCSSLNVRDQVSHSYRTSSKIIVLYILIVLS